MCSGSSGAAGFDGTLGYVSLPNQVPDTPIRLFPCQLRNLPWPPLGLSCQLKCHLLTEAFSDHPKKCHPTLFYQYTLLISFITLSLNRDDVLTCVFVFFSRLPRQSVNSTRPGDMLGCFLVVTKSRCFGNICLSES